MSTDGTDAIPAPPARTLHKLTILIVCLVWPLIWIGGLVTTYDAGMAVPDWPGTYGYNLFLYPYNTWLAGPFDLFIEHGHRLLAAVVGLVAIAIFVVAYRKDPRRWVTFLTGGVLFAVIFQGVLGGMRVVLSDRTLAMIHGCFGPAFFALCVVTAVVTSRTWWRVPSSDDASQRPIGKARLALAGSLVLVSYGQLVLGAQLRHVQPTASPNDFVLIVALHVMIAFGLWLLSGVAWLGISRCGDLTLSRPVNGLIGLVGLQIVLGVGTWVVNYGWPSFLEWFPGATGYLLQAKGFGDAIIVTAHVATGSLILAVSTLILARLWRLRSVRNQATLMHLHTDSESGESSPLTQPALSN